MDIYETPPPLRDEADPRRGIIGGPDAPISSIAVTSGKGGVRKTNKVPAFALVADAVLVVSTPDSTAITDAYAMIKMLRKRNYTGSLRPLVDVAADHAEANRVFRRLAGVTERFLHFPLADGGYILQDTPVELAVRPRRLFVLNDSRCPPSRCIAALADNLAPAPFPSGTTPGVMSRLAELFT